jgi:E3 ubiquitin-protein ligase CHFR
MKGNEANSGEEKPWAKLTSFTAQLDNANLVKDSYTLGRNSTNDIQIPDIRLSGVHCKIFKDAEDNIWIEDLSSNGTFIENDKIGKGTKKKLASGDKIYLLHQSKVKAEDILGYVFSSMVEDGSKLKRQREEDQKRLEEEKKQTEKQLKFQEDLGEEMRCCICIDYIYKCITLIPCLHNFCASCFSDWMQKSSMCPQCREEVIELKKNATVNNIIEKFMENNPSKKRPKEEYDEMDQKDKVKEDRINLKNLKKPAVSAPTSLFSTPVTTYNQTSLFGGPGSGSNLFRNTVAAPAARGRGRGRGRS